MTTIAWDGKILAVDSQCTVNDVVVSCDQQKLFLDVGPYRAVAITGSLQEMTLFVKWLDSHEDSAQPELRNGGVAACVCNNGILWTYLSQHKGNPYPEYGMFTSGTGYEIALGAMEAGVDAITAVKIACKRDVYTGGRIQHYDYFDTLIRS